MSDDVWIWPTHWPRHDQPHDPGDCHRCLLQADWVEAHDGCPCLDHEWFRADVGTPAVPDLQWTCGACLKAQGPSWAGDCICFWTDPSTWDTYYGAAVPASQMEPNPDCPVHFPGGEP